MHAYLSLKNKRRSDFDQHSAERVEEDERPYLINLVWKNIVIHSSRFQLFRSWLDVFILKFFMLFAAKFYHQTFKFIVCGSIERELFSCSRDLD